MKSKFMGSLSYCFFHKGYDGYFEYIKDLKGVINHRQFNKL